MWHPHTAVLYKLRLVHSKGECSAVTERHLNFPCLRRTWIHALWRAGLRRSSRRGSFSARVVAAVTCRETACMQHVVCERIPLFASAETLQLHRNKRKSEIHSISQKTAQVQRTWKQVLRRAGQLGSRRRSTASARIGTCCSTV
jgi:NAD-dependent oxidoreductase involved in siderophore biosynthesis